MKPDILSLLQHIAATVHRQADQTMQERLGIGIAQFRLLATLQEQPHVQQRFLADSLGQTEASISRQVKLLQVRGLLGVQVDSRNKRRHIMVLSAKGIKFTDAAREIADAYSAPVLGRLGDKEQEQLAQMLQHLHMQCCREGKPYACDLSQ